MVRLQGPARRGTEVRLDEDGPRALAGLLDWGASQGATTVWLHVETDNHAALALYGRLGLSAHHELRYLRAPH